MNLRRSLTKPPVTAKLGNSKLGFAGLYSQALGAMSPPYNGILVGAVVVSFAGRMAPIAFLLAGVGMLFYALTIIGLARNLHSAGGLYTVVAGTLGARAGLWFSGALLANGIYSIPATLISGAYLLELVFGSLLPGYPLLSSSWIFWVAVLTPLSMLVAYLGANLSSRVVLGLLGLGMAAILLLDVAILSHPGLAVHSVAVLWASHGTGTYSSLLLATGVAVLTMAGSESTIFMSEEAANPERHIPWAVLGSIGCALVFYLLTSLAFSAALPGEQFSDVWGKGGPGVLSRLGNQFVGSWYGPVTDILVALAAVAGVISFTNYIARLIFALARDRYLPAYCASVNRFGAPSGAVVMLAASTVLAYLAGFLWLGDGPDAALTYFSFLYIGVTLFMLSNYILVCVAAWRLGRVTGQTIWSSVCVPAVALAVLVLAAIAQFIPMPPPPFDVSAWIALILLATIGLIGEMSVRRDDRTLPVG